MDNRERLLLSAREKIEKEYIRRTPKSNALHEATQHFLPGGDTRTVTYFAPHPLFASHGLGCHLVDVDGNDYLDFLSNYTALVHGHAHPHISRAIATQLKNGTSFATPLRLQGDLAEILCGRVLSL
jgi:glutamate-1-semialdehyde 2,1-aminomutase